MDFGPQEKRRPCSDWRKLISADLQKHKMLQRDMITQKKAVENTMAQAKVLVIICLTGKVLRLRFVSQMRVQVQDGA